MSCVTTRKQHWPVCKLQRLWPDCTFVQSGQSLCSLLTLHCNFTRPISEQHMSWSDHTHAGLPCLYIQNYRFSYQKTHVGYYFCPSLVYCFLLMKTDVGPQWQKSIKWENNKWYQQQIGQQIVPSQEMTPKGIVGLPICSDITGWYSKLLKTYVKLHLYSNTITLIFQHNRNMNF